jgi:uncharacterized protein YbaR (Trm112 family)
MRLSEHLLNLLSCPVSGDKLEYNQERNLLISKKSKLAYPIIDGIPLLLESKAIKIENVKILDTEEA